MPQDLTTLLSQFLNALWAGTITFGSGTTGITEAAPGVIQIGGTPPTTNQGIRIPNGSNLEYGTVAWNSNFFNVGTVINGGTARNARVIAAGPSVALAPGGPDTWVFQAAGATTVAGLTTVGRGVGATVAIGRVTAQSAAVASIATFTVGAADGSFEVSANMNVTAAVTLATTLTVSYTDESNTARVMVFPVNNLTGTLVAAGAITGTGPWSTTVQHLRCKAATSITIGTTAGTFTTVTYTAEGLIRQLV